MMSLRGNPVEQPARLPDGRRALVRVAVPDDAYIARRDRDTVALELHVEGELAAVVNTVLSADDDSAGLELAREAVSGLESGRLEPTASALEPLADQLR